MSAPQIILAAIAVLLAIAFLVRWRASRPEFPPLQTRPDDPLMLEALEKARESLAEFMTLVRAAHQHALVKLRFESSGGLVEHLWAEVLEVIDDATLGVRLVTPPVTHSGSLDRLWRCTLDDVEDWQVRDAEGRIHGGFSQRAMFAIARRDGVTLPKELLASEFEYR